MKTHSNYRSSRDGIAPIEFALCLPVLLALVVAIVWLGASMIGQSEVTVEARDAAWKQRFENAAGTPLVFVSDAGDLVSATASTSVEVTPLLDDASPPESEHDVLAGTWDHRYLLSEDGPHWQSYVLAAANAKTGGLQNAYVDATNQVAQLQSLSNQLLSQSLAEAAAKFVGWDDFGNAANAAESSNAGQEARERAQALANVARLRGEIATVNAQIRQLKLQNADDEAKQKELDLRVALLETKRKRLQIEMAANQRLAVAL